MRQAFGETVEVNAKIESLKGISGHADRNGLLDWLSGFENTPQHVFVVHGEDQVTDTFAEAITESLAGRHGTVFWRMCGSCYR